MRSSTLKVFLLDADVIIWCAENNKLDALFKNKRIHIPQIIYEQVIHYTIPTTGQKKTILFDKFIHDGYLTIIDNPVTEEIIKIKDTYKQCPQLAEIHDGESECIATLLKDKECKFCTGDVDAMKVIGFWGLLEQAVSLEELVGRIKNLRPNFTKDCMESHLKQGAILRVQYSNWD